MTMSMTGFAARRGQDAVQGWSWDLRSVNGRGLDLRLRLPEGIDGLEPEVRRALHKAIGRGNVSLSLKLARLEPAPPPVRVNQKGLEAALAALAAVQAAAVAAGVTLTTPSSAEVLALRGVTDSGADEGDQAALKALLLQDLNALLDDFRASRSGEGQALARILRGQIARIAALVAEARTEAEAASAAQAAALVAQIARLKAEVPDAARLAQELALLATRADVTEELDRLEAHVAAARLLLDTGEPVGRRFEFLTQEFLREANTLCAKAASRGLTRIGLDLKTVIDQMREQAANLE